MRSIPAVSSERDLVGSLYRAHSRRLMGLAASLVGPEDAADLVSVVLIRLSQRKNAEEISNPTAYLNRTVINEARAVLRAAGRRHRREARFHAEPPAASPELTDPALFDALRRLPLRQRAVLFLTYWADLTPAAIANDLGISEGSVRRHLARARSTLRKELS